MDVDNELRAIRHELQWQTYMLECIDFRLQLIEARACQADGVAIAAITDKLTASQTKLSAAVNAATPKP